MKSHIFKSQGYKPTFSGHETFPLRYGWLQKAYRAVRDAPSPTDAAHIFRDAQTIAHFGVGRNMVSAIRYWSIAAGVIDETNDGLEVAWLGDMLFGKGGTDPFLEEDASLWLLHWHLVGRPRITSAYWLFNEFRGGSFVRQDLVASLLQLARERDWSRVASTTVDRDLQCLLRTYLGGRGTAEAGDSILAELGLVRPMDRHRSRLSRGRKPSLPNSIFAHCFNTFWDDYAADQTTMSFENVAYAPGSPGRVFLLDEDDIIERLEQLEDVTDGAMAWSETAGLRQVIRHKKPSLKQAHHRLRDELLSSAHREAA